MRGMANVCEAERVEVIGMRDSHLQLWSLPSVHFIGRDRREKSQSNCVLCQRNVVRMGKSIN